MLSNTLKTGDHLCMQNSGVHCSVPKDSSIVINIAAGIEPDNKVNIFGITGQLLLGFSYCSVFVQDFVEHVIRILVSLCNIWTTCTYSDIALQRLNSSMSNYVYIVRPTNRDIVKIGDPSIILLRIYGALNIMYDRTQEESIAIALATARLIPKFYGVFGNGRFEEFVENIPISPSNFRHIDTAKTLAIKLKNIHDILPIVISIASVEENNHFWRRFDILASAAEIGAKVLLLNKTLDQSRHKMLEDIMSWNVFGDHSDMVRFAEAQESPLVFGHCDLHHGNVLSVEDDFLIIDFEYAIPTARGLDFANLFCEFCSDYDAPNAHEMDFSLFPSSYDRAAIFMAYLSNQDSEDAEVRKIDNEMLAYLPFVHLQWAHWGLVKALQSHPSSFDYFKYAYTRYEQFNRLRQSFVG